jgi:hypothetical protein
MYALQVIIDRLRTARVVVRAAALMKDLGPYAAIELLLPGGSLLALGLWLYSRHKSGKPVLPFRFRAPIFSRPAGFLRSAVRRLPSPYLLAPRG